MKAFTELIGAIFCFVMVFVGRRTEGWVTPKRQDGKLRMVPKIYHAAYTLVAILGTALAILSAYDAIRLI